MKPKHLYIGIGVLMMFSLTFVLIVVFEDNLDAGIGWFLYMKILQHLGNNP